MKELNCSWGHAGFLVSNAGSGGWVKELGT